MASCPICRQSTSTTYSPKDYEYGVEYDGRVAACANCKIMFVDPQPAETEIPRFYPENYTSFTDDEASLHAFMIRRYYSSEAAKYSEILPSGGALLDIGCGEGTFLRYLGGRGRFQLTGLELDARAVAKGKKKNLDLLEGSLESSPLPSNSVDVIRINHVIEHLPNPMKALENAYRILKPGGTLIGETPNFDCWDFKILGKYWGGVHFPRHLYLFSHDSIRSLGEKAGFEVEAIDSCFRTVGWSAGIQNLVAGTLDLRPPPSGRFFWYPLLILLFLPVTSLQKLFGKSGIMEFRFRKPV